MHNFGFKNIFAQRNYENKSNWQKQFFHCFQKYGGGRLFNLLFTFFSVSEKYPNKPSKKLFPSKLKNFTFFPRVKSFWHPKRYWNKRIFNKINRKKVFFLFKLEKKSFFCKKLARSADIFKKKKKLQNSCN